MAVMATPKTIPPRSTGAIQNCARLAKGPQKFKGLLSRVRFCNTAPLKGFGHDAKMSSELYDRIIAGDPNAVARAISKVEDAAPDSGALMKSIFSRTGRALVVGITGSPGAGKSSLVDKLAAFYRQRGDRVGIIAVDPSSPFSGGAILG